MGVISIILVTCKPEVLNALIAASLPPPGPLILTSTETNPLEIASSAAFWVAWVAANGVLFLEPLNPKTPALAHDIALPN